VRVTAAGAKSFVYEAKLNRQTIRRTIVDVRIWSIDGARKESRRIGVMLDGGTDPRQLERQQQADHAAATAAAAAQALTVGELWPQYLETGRPKRREAWKPRYLADLKAMAGKHQATRALMMFRGFLRWCAARPEYRAMTDREAGRAAAILENLPRNTKRTDALEAAQVPGWWAGVEQLSNRTASAYLRALLLTGARREELAALTWTNVDFQWRKLTIAD